MSHVFEREQRFATLKLPFEILIFKMFIKKQKTERTCDPALFPTQEIQTEKPALGKELGLGHLMSLHLRVSQVDPKPVS